uniref:hypothetical protein n=1 Tax=Flavobacterium sp. TaxID=239 RepID=UPI00404B95D9
MRFKILYLFLIFGLLTTVAQPVDKSNDLPSPDGFGKVEIPEGEEEAKPKPRTFEENKFEENRPSLITPKNKLSMTKDYGFKKPVYEYKPKWLNQDDGMRDEYKVDKYFGDFRVHSENVTLYCRDHMYVDGDRVRVILNGEVVEYDIFLTSQNREIKISLKEGRNVVEVIALNQGTSGPNTAAFEVYDDNGYSVLNNIWNLATGVKASFTIIRY